MSHQQPPPQPDDFPGIDLAAWRAAMPFPGESNGYDELEEMVARVMATPGKPDGLDKLIALALKSAEATPEAPEDERSDDDIPAAW